MKNKILIGVLALSLSGCVVSPGYYTAGNYYTPVSHYAPAPYYPPVQVYSYNPNYVVYPSYGSAYIYDSSSTSFYFQLGGYRHYMQSGWSFNAYGAPQGYWHGQRRR